jgi:hypothetical protein
MARPFPLPAATVTAPRREETAEDLSRGEEEVEVLTLGLGVLLMADG